MSYENLLKDRIIEPCEVSDGEIADHLRSAKRDVHVAKSVEGTDLDWAFNIAYNGILQAALAYMYFLGFRPRGEGKHYNTFRFLKEALPDSFQKEIGQIQRLRKKRNQSVYGSRGLISETEAKNIIAFSQRFLDELAELFPRNIVELSKEE